MKKLLAGILFILVPGFLLSTLSYAQDESDREIEEIIVIAELTITQVREQIVEIQQEIYRMFNASNSSNNFDFQCRMETPTGTHFRRQVCEPTFLAKARQRNIGDSVRGLDIQVSTLALESELKKEFDQLNAEFATLYSREPAFAEVVNILTVLNTRLEEF